MAYLDETPVQYTKYRNHQRNGLLKLWSEKGEQIYWGEYLDGQRHGFCCLFEDGQLSMVADWDMDKLQSMVVLTDGEVSKEFSDVEITGADPEGSAMLAQLAQVEKDLAENERHFKTRLRGELRDLKEAQRRQRVARLNPMKRANMQGRMNQRAAQQRAHIGALRRISGM